MNASSKRQKLQAYLAGILDGEGSFGIYFCGAWTARVTLEMQDPQAVLLMKVLYPKCYFGTSPAKSGKLAYRVIYRQHNAWDVICDFIPFLLAKHDQAKILKSFLVHRRRDHQQKAGNGHAQCDRCKYFADLVKQTRVGSKGAKTVDSLLKHEMRQYRAKLEDVEELVKQFHGLLEGVETRLMSTTDYKAASTPEQDIVQP